MSEPRVAALVCEGQTDVPILRAAIQEVWPELEEVRCLQPELDETDRAKGPAGWSQVKAWCEAHATDLDDVLDPDIGGPIDLLIIAIDVDVAIEAGIANPPKGVGAYETTRLRKAMLGWFQESTRRHLPPAVVFSTPVMSVESWIIAALYRNEKNPEAIGDPAKWLASKKKLRNGKDGKPWKELYLYQEFAPVVARRLKQVRKSCSEAERTLRLVEQRREALEGI